MLDHNRIIVCHRDVLSDWLVICLNARVWNKMALICFELHDVIGHEGI